MDGNKLWRNFVEIKEPLNFKKNFTIIKNVLLEPSMYGDMPRKSFIKRFYENLKWYLLHLEPCRYYNSYGFDIVDFRNQKEYISYRRFRIERNNENCYTTPFRPYENQTSILRDKIIFAAFFGQLLGSQYVIENLGYIEPSGQVYDLRTHQCTTLANLLENYPKDLFVKKLFGECGAGVYVLNKQTSDIANLANAMRGSKYIIQPRLEQHPVLNQLNSSCVNTIRIITVWSKRSQKAFIFSHLIRFGINSINDNRATGGFSVGILPNGVLCDWEMGHHYRTQRHPVSNICFERYSIPYFEEVKTLVTRAHALIPNVISIGWDVAITPTGPVLLEGNDNWEISGPQDTAGGLKTKWYQLQNL